MLSKNQLFTITRLKLSLLYVAIILSLTSAISGLIYWRTSDLLEMQFNHMRQRLENEFSNQQMRGPQFYKRWKVSREDLALVKRDLLMQLIRLNIFIAIVVLLLGFYLSGKTLKPIEEALNQQKRFISDASHELRTPITALKTGLEVGLLNKKLSADSKNLLESYLQDTQDLEELTNNLLSLAKNESDNYQISAINIKSLINKVVKKFQALAKRKSLQLIVKEQKLDVLIKGDALAMEQLLSILLDNAIKYSPNKQKIIISLQKKQKLAILTVQDFGMGIDQQHLPHIFDRFYRADEARSRTNRGFGLGLAIAKTIVEKHRGFIKATSILGKGTSLVVSLPLA